MRSRTLYQMFLETVQRGADRPALGWKQGKAENYEYLTYAQLLAKVKEMRQALDALGLRRGERLALLCEGRPEWAITDLAAQSLGLVLIAPYTTLPAAQTGDILRDSAAAALILSDAKQLAKILPIRASLPELRHLIVIDADAEKIEAACAISWADLLAKGKSSGRSEAELDLLSAAVSPEDAATFIYTSGTTGEPKGAMLSHLNLLQTTDAIMDENRVYLGDTDVFLSFLPLSHISERVGGHYIPLQFGSCIVYSQGLLRFGEELTKTLRPTAMISVPRLWQNIHEKALDAFAKMPEDKRKKVEWGIEIGKQVVRLHSQGKKPGLILGLKHRLADKLILSKVREQVTGGNLRYCVSGGAPLDEETGEFFLGIGIQILEGYGLSETNIIAINRPNKQRLGTVGNLLAAVELKIADDGEIWMRGQGRMKGYHNKPEDTAQAIDAEGWFHTGDIGELSADGYVKITDRKKDLLVLANGKKVAPQPIEADLKRSPYIAEAVLLGDRQATVGVLLVPDFNKLTAWAKEKELPADPALLLANEATQKLFKAEIDAQTKHLADYEKIKRFRLIEKPFTIDGGELTPTLKVKRKVVNEKYADLIASMSR